MARRPSKGEPVDSGPVPLPDRTRVEVSPFAEEPGSDTSRLPQVSDSPPPRSSRRHTAQPSIIVDDALDSGAAPPSGRKSTRMAPKAKVREPDEEVEPAPDSQATRIGAPPERRPSRGDPSDENATSAGPPISVECVDGPDRGTRLPIRGGRMIIGRGDGCDFKLSDTSVSRRHLELTAGPGGVVLRDLGSGNGTRVNGKKEVEAALEHGDKIALGETVLKVVDEVKQADADREAARAPPARPPPRRPGPRVAEPEPEEVPDEEAEDVNRTTGVLERIPERHRPPPDATGVMQKFQRLPMSFKLLAGGVVLLALLVIIALARGSGTPAKPAVDPKVKAEQTYDVAFQAARKLLMENKYQEALEKAQEAQAALSTPVVERLIASCEEAIKSKGALADARGAAARGDYDRALEKLKEIEESSPMSEEATELAKTWTQKKLEVSLEKIRLLANDGDVDGARTLIDALPPEHQERMRRELVEMEKQYKQDAASRQRAQAAAAARARADRVRRQRQEIDDAVAPVVRRIDTADFEGAVRQCDRVAEAARNDLVAAKVKLLKKTIPMFGQAYNDGMSRYNGGAYEQAATSLLRALKLYEDMDIDGKLDKPLKEKAGAALAYKGRAAAARQDYGAAAKAYKEALRLNPGSKEATDGLAKIRRAAEEVYQEAYAVKDRDAEAARRRFRDVIEMVPAGDELAKKAQKRLNELDGQ